MKKAIVLEGDFTSDQLAAEISDLWSSWDSGRVEAKRRWKEVIEYVFATSTRETTNKQNEWSHSTHIPKITQIYDNLIANYMYALFPNEDWLKFVGYDNDAVAAAKRLKIEGYMRTKHAQNDFELEIQKCLGDWLLHGNCFARVDYVVQKHVDLNNVPTVVYAGSKVSRISPYDIVFNPLAPSFYDSPKITRSLRSFGELARDLEEQPELKYDLVVFNKMREWRSQLRKYSVEEINKTVQLRFDGFSNPHDYVNSSYVELLEFHGDIYDIAEDKLYKNHLITVADRQWVLRKVPYYTADGQPPIFHCGWRPRPDNSWSMGPLDNLVGMQYLINHLENARADAMDQMIFPTRVLVGDVEEEGIQDGRSGGRFIIASGEGSVDNLVPDTTILNADFQIQRKEDEMELYAGAPREAAGVRTPGEKTAFEVDSLATAASRMFNNKANYFNKMFVEKVVNSELETGIRNLDGTDTVAMDNTYGAIDFATITKEDIYANGKLIPMGARHFARESQLVQNLQVFSTVLQQDPIMAQHFPTLKLAKVWEDLLGFQKFDLLTPFGRVQEEVQLQRLGQAATEDLAVEQQVDEEGNIGGGTA
jgi:hypothetical protein